MKRFATILLCTIICISAFAQTSTTAGSGVLVPEYQLYPTQNNWTFLELETSTGRVWQVQYGIKGDGSRFKVVLNPNSLLRYDENPTPGRFRLSATNNLYNFLLLDTCDGRVWQIQWSLDNDERGMIGLIHETSPQSLGPTRPSVQTPSASRIDKSIRFRTISGLFEVVEVYPPSSGYNYWVIELSSCYAMPMRKDVYLLTNDGQKIKCCSKPSNSKFSFSCDGDFRGRLIINGEDTGEIELSWK